MKTRRPLPIAIILLLAAPLFAADYRVELLEEGPPTEGLSKEITEKLGTQGVRLISGTSRVICDIWFCKEWAVKPGFEATGEVLYPFSQGQLMGVARYMNKGVDFRDQDIGRGIYTLRYDLQPIDGDHVGTSPTRDFLLLVLAEQDESTDNMDVEELSVVSAEAVETNHPGMLCLMEAKKDGGEKPSIRHDENNDWWIARLKGKANDGKKTWDFVIEVVLVGYSEA